MVSWESSCLSPEYILRPQNMSGSQMRTLAVTASPDPLLRRQVGNVKGNLKQQLIHGLWHIGPVLSVVRNKNPTYTTYRGFKNKDTVSLTPLEVIRNQGLVNSTA